MPLAGVNQRRTGAGDPVVRRIVSLRFFRTSGSTKFLHAPSLWLRSVGLRRIRVHASCFAYDLRPSGDGLPSGQSLKNARGILDFPGSAQSLQVAGKNVVRSSVGAGLTWASPFGALTVNYAVPLSKAAYDVVQPLSFTADGF
jgi:hypothetical protein